MLSVASVQRALLYSGLLGLVFALVTPGIDNTIPEHASTIYQCKTSSDLCCKDHIIGPWLVARYGEKGKDMVASDCGFRLPSTSENYGSFSCFDMRVDPLPEDEPHRRLGTYYMYCDDPLTMKQDQFKVNFLEDDQVSVVLTKIWCGDYGEGVIGRIEVETAGVFSVPEEGAEIILMEFRLTTITIGAGGTREFMTADIAQRRSWRT